MHKINPGQKMIIFLTVILLFVFGMVISDKFENKAKADVDAEIYFDPSQTAINLNQNFNLDAKINPGTNNKITAVTVDVTFDETKFSLEAINASDSFKTVFPGKTINNDNGTASVSVGISIGVDQPVTSVATVATFVFKSKDSAVSSSSISFTNNTVAAALDENDNARGEDVISTRTPATVTVNGRTYSLPDFVNLVSRWLTSYSGADADVNSDGKANSRDLGIMMSNWSN